jgi:transcriptional regulator with XRE-family HTH domain
MWYNEYNVVTTIQRKESVETMFGEFVKSRRVANRITLRAFSESLGYDPANYSRMERGQLLPPASHEKLVGFARELGISQESQEFREMVRLAALGRGEIPPAILADQSIVSKLPVLFRTLEGDKVDEAVLDELFEAMNKE